MTLYNKVRPHTFREVKGQDGIVNNLKSQSRHNAFFGTYVFAGQYGSGKTTLARIMAAAINCENKGEDGEPCCQCAACRSILNKTAVDFVEIDGASNTGVDKVREIIADAAYQPVALRKKVICIDEVHMLSTSAFNALLKTLEEPPESSVFILCTTEERKIPETVRSRAACYTFGRIDRTVISEHLKGVSEAQGIPAEQEAISLIARRSDGSMRNALSLFEQAAGSGKVTEEAVRALLSVSDTEGLAKMLDGIFRHDIKGTAAMIGTVLKEASPINVISDLSDMTSDLMLKNMGALAEEDREYTSVLSGITAGTEELLALSDVLIGLRDRLRQGAGREVILIELCKYMYREDRVAVLEKKVSELEKALEAGGPVPTKAVEGVTLGNGNVEDTHLDNISASEAFEEEQPLETSEIPDEEPQKDISADEDPFGFGMDNLFVPDFGFEDFSESPSASEEPGMEAEKAAENTESVPDEADVFPEIAPDVPVELEQPEQEEPEQKPGSSSSMDVWNIMEQAENTGDGIFLEALKACRTQTSGGKVVFVTTEEPICRIVCKCLDVYGIDAVCSMAAE